MPYLLCRDSLHKWLHPLSAHGGFYSIDSSVNVWVCEYSPSLCEPKGLPRPRQAAPCGLNDQSDTMGNAITHHISRFSWRIILRFANVAAVFERQECLCHSGHRCDGECEEARPSELLFECLKFNMSAPLGRVVNWPGIPRRYWTSRNSSVSHPTEEVPSPVSVLPIVSDPVRASNRLVGDVQLRLPKDYFCQNR